MSDPKNIVLVSMDSLRGDHCGMLDSTHSLTPTMDRLAAEGVNYENAIAPGPQTFSSMPAVFTGRHRSCESLETYPGDTHWERRIAAIRSHLSEFVPFPERLQAEGYTTAAVSPNPWTSTATGFDRGFDEFVDLSSEGTDGRLAGLLDSIPGLDSGNRALKLTLNMVTGSSFFARWTDLAREVSRLRATLPEPYFLWVFLLDTHYPFLAARRDREEQSLLGMYRSAYRSEGLMRGRTADERMPPDVRASLLRGYRDTVRASDRFLDSVLSGDDDPVLVVHSDHGESFGGHGNYGHHHRELYEENIHVPYVVHNAGVREDVTEPVSLARFPETVLEIARTGTIRPRAYTAEAVLSTSECGTNRALRGKRFKYVRHGNEASLFDLREDPHERNDLSDERPSLAARLQERIEAADATEAEHRRLVWASHEIADEF